jgi:hypothetical protein
MGYADIIANEVKLLPAQKQAEILDFISFLKTRRTFFAPTQAAKTSDEIEAFFRSFNLEAPGYRFDRDDANAR